MLRRRHHPQAQTAREAKGRQEADENGRPGRGAAGGVHRCTVHHGHSEMIAFFDLDDTLCDREAAFARWATGFCATHDLDPAIALPFITDIDERGTRPRTGFFAEVADRFGLATPVDELVAAYHPAYTALYRLDPAVGAGIRELRNAGWTVGIVTNG